MFLENKKKPVSETQRILEQTDYYTSKHLVLFENMPESDLRENQDGFRKQESMLTLFPYKNKENKIDWRNVFLRTFFVKYAKDGEKKVVKEMWLKSTKVMENLKKAFYDIGETLPTINQFVRCSNILLPILKSNYTCIFIVDFI